jgi:CheY-like chemotaxis protein
VEELADAVRAADRAGDLTSQLLMFSRRQVPVSSALQLNVVVEETRNMLERLIGESVQLETRLAAAAPRVLGDAGQLAQVVVNLVVNARDAMPNGGHVVISTVVAHGAPPCDAVGAQSAASATRWTVLEVADEGHGFDAVTRERIFEPFFTTKEVGKGTGLGLATVYGIVTAMKGAIEVSSVPGAGATFRLWLPAASADAPQAAPPLGVVPAGARGRGTVLVVEDEYMVRNLVCRVLEGAGYRVCEARHGREALEMICGPDALPDLIVSDVVMPEMGGREFAQQLRRRSLLIPMVFISGYSDDSSPLAGTRTQAAMLVPKPFTAVELVARVRAVLSEPGLG